MELIPYYRLFTVCNKKTSVKGFWLDNGKIYRDNLTIKDYTLINSDQFRSVKRTMFLNGEKAVFYINPKRQGIIEASNGEKNILYHNKVYKVASLKASFIKVLLHKYGGLTVYREGDNYRIEVYY